MGKFYAHFYHDWISLVGEEISFIYQCICGREKVLKSLVVRANAHTVWFAVVFDDFCKCNTVSHSIPGDPGLNQVHTVTSYTDKYINNLFFTFLQMSFLFTYSFSIHGGVTGASKHLCFHEDVYNTLWLGNVASNRICSDFLCFAQKFAFKDDNRGERLKYRDR